MSLQERFVKPHKVISKVVTDADIEQVIKETETMIKLCYLPHGMHKGAFAIAHSQIEDKNPLAFFVDRNCKIIINPKILWQEGEEEKFEGCMSYPEFEGTKVKRFHKIKASYQTITDDRKLSKVKTANYANLKAQIWQHEIAHLEGKYII